MTEGWVGGLVVEAVLKSAGWPATPTRSWLHENMKVDTKGLRGSAARVDQDQPCSDQASPYRVYHWDAARSKSRA